MYARLFSATELPGFGTPSYWRIEQTYPYPNGDDGVDSASSCGHTGFESIGATREVRRDYVGPKMSRASEVLARFADEQSAERGYAVWLAWHDDCAAWVRGQGQNNAHIYPTTPVHPARGEAFWWLITQGPVTGHPHAAFFETSGILRVDRTLALVVNVHVGPPVSKPPRSAPVARALLLAAERLG